MMQGVTFRLHDAVPPDVLQEWKAELGLLSAATKNDRISPAVDGKRHARPFTTSVGEGAPRRSTGRTVGPATGSAGVPPATDSRVIELAKRIARYEDAGHGACWLRDERIARLLEDSLLRFDGRRYHLLAWCVMLNHVHVLIETVEPWPLAGVIHSWKSYTAHEANRVLDRQGEFWQREYHDRYIRNSEHHLAAVRYIERNPVKAGLVERPDEWLWSSAKFRAGRSTGGPATGSAGDPLACSLVDEPAAEAAALPVARQTASAEAAALPVATGPAPGPPQPEPPPK